MKHAMLLTAYNDFDVLTILLKYYSQFYDCYVHIDKKVHIPADFMEELDKIKIKNIYIFQKYRVNWGGMNHVKAIILLMEEASPRQYDYYHILPANCFPVKNFQEMSAFFEKSKQNFIEMLPVKGNSYLEDRQRYFYFCDLINLKRKYGNRLLKKIVEWQKKIGIKRKLEFQWKGYVYCHLTQDSIISVLGYIKNNPNYLERLRFTYIPEEFFFQNIVAKLNLKYTSDTMIYDDWNSGRGGVPAVLEETDICNMFGENYLFARKIRDISLAEEIIGRLREK